MRVVQVVRVSGSGVLATALACALWLTLTAASPAGGAVKERVKVSIPDPGQLAAARLQFKVKGDKSPKLKLKLKNARALPDEVIAAAQMTRSTERKRRAVALLAIGNVPPTDSARRSARIIGQDAVVEVKSAETGTRISEIELENVPGSRNFASVLGLEPAAERASAQDTFDLPENRIPDDEFGRFDLTSGLKVMGLRPVQEATIVTRPSFPEEVEDLFRLRGIASAIAGAIGPPAVLDANLYSLVTGEQAPFVLQSDFGPSQSDPSLYFVGAGYSLNVMGVQASQASELDLLDGPGTRCENGFFDEGLVTRGIGPRLSVGAGYRLDCDLSQDHQVIFFDIRLEGVPSPGTDVFRLMPFPYYGTIEIGEAVGGEQTTVVVRSP